MSGQPRARGDAGRLLRQPRGPAPALRAGADALHPAAEPLVQPLHAHAVDRHAHRAARRRARRVLPRHRQSRSASRSARRWTRRGCRAWSRRSTRRTSPGASRSSIASAPRTWRAALPQAIEAVRADRADGAVGVRSDARQHRDQHRRPQDAPLREHPQGARSRVPHPRARWARTSAACTSSSPARTSPSAPAARAASPMRTCSAPTARRVDPRLNHEQALELAMLIAERSQSRRADKRHRRLPRLTTRACNTSTSPSRPTGRRITDQSRRLAERPRPADHSLHRRRRHRHRRHAGDAAGGGCRGREGLRRAGAASLDGSVLRREGQRPLRPVVPGRDAAALREFVVSIKGPLGTPVGGGMRSLNVAMRQSLDLYACVRPIRYFPGVASPMAGREPHRHGGVPREHRGHLRRHRVAGRLGRGAQAHRLPAAASWRSPASAFPASSGIGIKPVSKEGSQRLIRKAIQYAIEQRSRLGDAGAQGQHHEVHGRRLPQLGLPAGAGGVRRQGRSAAGPWLSFPEPAHRQARSSSRT